MFDYEELSKKYNVRQLEKLQNHVPIVQKCMGCGGDFDSLSYHFRTTAIHPFIKKTCSKSCTNIYAGNIKRKFIAETVCAYCKHEFTPNPKKPRKKYCNHKCYTNSLKGKPNPVVSAYNLRYKKTPPKGSISRWELKWLSQFELTHTQYQLVIDRRSLIVDGFNEHTKTVYEYFGSFWHGNPNVYDPHDINVRTKTTFGELYVQTQERIERIINAGYNLVFEWSPR